MWEENPWKLQEKSLLYMSKCKQKRGGSEGNGHHVTSSHASAVVDYSGKSFQLSVFFIWVHSIFPIITVSKNYIQWSLRRNEKKKHRSFKTQKATKTFSHHRIDLWKVKSECYVVEFGRSFWSLVLPHRVNIKFSFWNFISCHFV